MNCNFDRLRSLCCNTNDADEEEQEQDDADEEEREQSQSDDGEEEVDGELEPAMTEEASMENVRFYRNERAFPDGVTIETFLTEWNGDYDRLEKTHDYVQWIFPCSQASEFNAKAQALTKTEAAVMAADATIQGRLLRSFKLMLDFLGLELQEQTAMIVPGGWANGLRNIKQNNHNLLRITRILQCLRETGMLKWQVPFITALLPHEFPLTSVKLWKQELDWRVLSELDVIENKMQLGKRRRKRQRKK